MMTFRRLLLSGLMAAAFGLVSAGGAQAQCGGCGYGGYGYGYWDIGRLYSVLADRVPYYAAFPPVYYSYPVPRTYGYSPFAYPPGVMTPEIEMAQPLSITNPYYKGEATAAEPAAAETAAPADRTTAAPPASAPLVIINPYVQAPALATR
jgi:hypothetical protein